jgi:hypothetical protein
VGSTEVTTTARDGVALKFGPIQRTIIPLSEKGHLNVIYTSTD